MCTHVMQVIDRSSWWVFNESVILFLNVAFRLMLRTWSQLRK
jgi:hypothetical protein